MTAVLYLGGFGRSGTTLVERVLDQLPEVCALGEVVHLWHRGLLRDERCGCGRSFSLCPVWQQIGEVAFGGWHTVDARAVHALGLSVDRSRFLPALAASPARSRLRQRAREYADWYARIYAAAAEVTGSATIVDSSKNASLAYVLREHEDLDLRVLHVVRDARGVAYSWTKDVVRPEAGVLHQVMDKYTPGRSAVLWTAHNLFFELLRRQGTAVQTLCYEQMLADPRGALAELLPLLGLPPATGGRLDFLGSDEVDLRPSHTVAGNPMRFTVGRLALRTDDGWRNQLGSADRRRVTALTWPLLLRYGYRPTTNRRAG